MTTRLLIGLGVGSGSESADAAAVRADGFGLAAASRVAGTARVPLPRRSRPADAAREVGDALAAAARQAAGRAGAELSAALAAGFLTRRPDASPAEWVAERTGLTVVTGFAGRDVVAGGGGHLVTPAADFLLFRDPAEERLLVHLGSVTSAVLLPASDRVTEVLGFECGPGNRLLDDLTALGTRDREAFDPSGTKAVQGRCDEGLLARWLAMPFLAQRPPRPVPRSAFGPAFLTDAFEATRAGGGTLHDLLCTATHFVTRCVGVGCERWLPAAPRRVLVSGGGARNGFLWKLLADQFPGRPVERLDALGVPAGLRTAAAAAVLAGLALDGVPATLPQITGASGSRLAGRFVPGDRRNWAACATWMAEQMADSVTLPRAA